MNLLLFAIVATLVLGATFLVFRALRSANSSGARSQFDLTDQELALLPERIKLNPLDPGKELPAALIAPARELCEEGFEDAGTFTASGIPLLMLRLLANRTHSTYAVLWHHVEAGSWIEVSSQYPGGNKCTFTTLCGAGLDGRPGHTIVRFPGMSAIDLFLRHCSERPMGVFKPVSVGQAASDFENAYLMWRAWKRASERAVHAA